MRQPVQQASTVSTVNDAATGDSSAQICSPSGAHQPIQHKHKHSKQDVSCIRPGTKLPRRSVLLSVSGSAGIPLIGKALKDEFSLWQQVRVNNFYALHGIRIQMHCPVVHLDIAGAHNRKGQVEADAAAGRGSLAADYVSLFLFNLT